MSEPEDKAWTRGQGVEILWRIAQQSPEQTYSSIRNQVRCCKNLYLTYGYQPALQRLSELANIEAPRTKNKLRGQESAASHLKRFLKSIKPSKTQGIQ